MYVLSGLSHPDRMNWHADFYISYFTAFNNKITNLYSGRTLLYNKLVLSEKSIETIKNRIAYQHELSNEIENIFRKFHSTYPEFDLDITKFGSFMTQIYSSDKSENNSLKILIQSSGSISINRDFWTADYISKNHDWERKIQYEIETEINDLVPIVLLNIAELRHSFIAQKFTKFLFGSTQEIELTTHHEPIRSL